MENRIKQSYEQIKLPRGAEERIQNKIEEKLNKPMRELRVVLKPRKKLWRPILAAAAVILLLLGSGVLFSYLRATRPAMILPPDSEQEQIRDMPKPAAPAEPEMAETTLSEEEYREIQRILNEISAREEPFALSDYAARQADVVVTLLGQIGRYMDSDSLTAAQIRGLLYGRLNLDGASAQAYADLMLKLYQSSPAEFLWAWHEAGEPAELMLEITGMTDLESGLAWMQAQWQVYYGTDVSEAEAILRLIQETEDEDALLQERLQNAVTQGDMNSLAQQRYELWDRCLNSLLQELQKNLVEEEMRVLTAAQLAWIQEKETAVQNAGKEVEGGSLYPLVTYQTAAELTRERVYQLAGPEITRQLHAERSENR